MSLVHARGNCSTYCEHDWWIAMKVDTGLIEVYTAVNHNRPLANSAIMSTLTVHCQWEDEAVRDRTGHPPSYAKAKKLKSLPNSSHPWLPQGTALLLLIIFYQMKAC